MRTRVHTCVHVCVRVSMCMFVHVCIYTCRPVKYTLYNIPLLGWVLLRVSLYMYNMSVYSNDESKDKALDCHKLMEATVEISSYQKIGNMITFTEQSHLPVITT